MRSAWAALAVLVLAGCGGFRGAPAADTLQDWSAVPLAPNPALASQALTASVCRGGDAQAGPLQVVLEDRRTAQTAAFLVTGPSWVGSCLITLSNGNASGGGSNQPRGPFDGPLALDELSNGGVGAGTASLAGGRIIDGVAAVEVDLPDGRVVTASVGQRHWLAWWPGDLPITRLVARSGDGTVLATIDDPIGKMKGQ